MLDAAEVRSHFPALKSGAVFLDNPGGTQVAQEVITRMTSYLERTNANHGGVFRTSVESDALVAEARIAAADFLNARCPEEIVFGQNMTTLTLHLSRSLARLLQEGDEIVVCRLDHDANVAPWLLVAEDRGCTVRWLDFDPTDCTWSVDDLRALIGERTRLVALGYASNAVGTINPLKEAVQAVHEAGAICFVDAVHYAPHGPIDVQDLDCDFLVCSAYKFFGPHVGVLYGKYDCLDRLFAYKVRPAGNRPPDKLETGTQNFEGIAGTLGALEYLNWIGLRFGARSPAGRDSIQGRRPALKAAMRVIGEYELGLSRALIEGLSAIRGLRIWGIADATRLERRTPTVSFTLEGRTPREIARQLAEQDLYVWDGNYYALAVTERLGLEGRGGMVRVGAAHYNTRAEVERLTAAVERIAAR
jgi:cysteine desulfurase family protein (TIGR01976 family)